MKPIDKLSSAIREALIAYEKETGARTKTLWARYDSGALLIDIESEVVLMVGDDRAR
ncbi:MAG: hypothetical protein ABFD89_26625 [Bryobacteraceae bacterium]